MKIARRKTRVIKIGDLKIGGNYPVAIQSMVKTKTSDVRSTLAQIRGLAQCGCEVVRLAVKDNADAKALKSIKQGAKIPLVADIHFDWRLALEAIDAGVDKIRLNPGNIYKKEEVRQVARAAKSAGIPIRVGANSGSLRQRSKTQAQSMVKSVLDYLKILENAGFYDIVISLKASNIIDTIEAYRLISKRCDYPLHLGVTATGLPFAGAIKSSIAIGSLLLEGLGDTIRISLTDDPRQEVRAGKVILEALALRRFGHEVISCPTCGRCAVNLIKVVNDLENKLVSSDMRVSGRPLKIAVMGCVVNGPGEAREADIGIAFGRSEGLLFKKGKPVKKVSVSGAVNTLLREIRREENV